MEQEYVKNRLSGQMKYYKEKCASLKKEYYILSAANIILLALIPVVTLAADKFTPIKYIIASMSATASILSSILLLHRTKDKWLEYRSTYEQLKSEEAKYSFHIGIYADKEEKERDHLFMERCEDIMEREHTDWKARMKQDPSQQ